MSSSLTDLMTAMTIEIAYHNDWTIAVAHAHVHQQLVHARSQYRALGAPYSNNEEGFVRWFTRARIMLETYNLGIEPQRTPPHVSPMAR